MSAEEPRFALDRGAARRAFDAAAATYDAAAQLQQGVRAELLERLQFFALSPAVVLDLGAGTGQAALQLQRRYPRAQVLALDIAAGMLALLRQPWWQRLRGRRIARLCADAHALPLASHSVDLVLSNLMLQWSDALPALCAEIARVLRPNGLFLFTTFGPETLLELRTAWAEADRGEHVSAFADMPALAEVLVGSGLAEPVMDVEQQVRHYPDAYALMRELKQIGARNAVRTRSRGLTGRTRMQAMIAAYERHRTARGLPATYEIIFGAAFGGGRTRQPPATTERGEVAVPIERIARRGGQRA